MLNIFNKLAVPVLVNRAIGFKNILGCIENAKAKVVIGSWPIRILTLVYSNVFQACKLFISVNSLDFNHKVDEVAISIVICSHSSPSSSKKTQILLLS